MLHAGARLEPPSRHALALIDGAHSALSAMQRHTNASGVVTAQAAADGFYRYGGTHATPLQQLVVTRPHTDAPLH